MKIYILTIALFSSATCLKANTYELPEKLLYSDDYQIHEKLPNIPEPWNLKENGDVNPDQSFKLRIHLKNLNVAAFQQKVLDISTPGHPTYGQHMTREEVYSYLAPHPESFQLVHSWLVNEDAGNVTLKNDWFVVDSTIGQVERLLRTRYHLFENGETDKLTIRTLGYSLPRSLHDYIDIVAPTIKFSTPASHRSSLVDWPTDQEQGSKVGTEQILDNGLAAACNTTITLDCLKDLYNVRGFSGSKTNGNKFALAGFLEQYAQFDDLEKFVATYAPEASGSTFSTVLVNGGLNTQQNVTNTPVAMGEANLDIQYAVLAYPIPTTYISTGGRPPETTAIEVDNEPYLEFLTFLLAAPEIPQTISISYGDSEFTVPETYARTVCDLFSQLAARGATVLVSSGDSGAGTSCNQTVPGILKYTPSFPASCPFVTTVGATYHVAPEVAVAFSGGGFSDVFTRPAYQEDTVAQYLKTADPVSLPLLNSSGRAYPDVSAQGVNYHVFVRGIDVLESGTSASAPAFASLIALLNSDRIDRGLPPYGFLNPLLYSNASATFTDIVSGKGMGCREVQGSGFQAVPGWDPVTGLGTPDFQKMLQLIGGVTVAPDKAA